MGKQKHNVQKPGNIVHHFECDEQHGFRFVLLLKKVLKFFLSDRMVY